MSHCPHFLRRRDDESEPFECPAPITCQFPRCDCREPEMTIVNVGDELHTILAEALARPHTDAENRAGNHRTPELTQPQPTTET